MLCDSVTVKLTLGRLEWLQLGNMKSLFPTNDKLAMVTRAYSPQQAGAGVRTLWEKISDKCRLLYPARKFIDFCSFVRS
ncbi:hypothetical protein K439DRAFT_151121 [Ramaria rubella]|nr:hypothetical protein K439DRAFT_151121 [Ramaria rubella]